MNSRTAVSDLNTVVDSSPHTPLIVQCDINTLNTPYKSGLTSAASGTAYITGGSDSNYTTMFYIPASDPNMFIRSRANGTWHDWDHIITNADFAAIQYNDLDKNSIVLELLNGFQSLDDAFMPLTVKKAAGLTIIIGHFKAGTTLNNWTSITSLPSGYRPTKQLRIFHSIGTDKGYGILIGVDGSVQIYNATSISEGDMLSINVAY